MNQQLPMQIYPYCEKKTLNTNFCVYCGHKLLKTTICPYCYTTNPINASSYAYCRHNQSSLELGNKLKDSPLFNSTFNIFRPSILVIVLLSGYSLIQMLIGSVLLLVFPSDFFIDPSNLALLSLIVLLVSNTLLITILLKLKLKSFTYHSPLPKNSQISLIFLLLLLLIVFISIIEIVVTIIDFGLNLIHVDPSIASPYDEYFSTPLNLLAFMILITIFGPILEELIFRRYTISTMLNQCQSKFLVVCTSALIFSLSHTATNLATNVRYAVLHFFATFILGIVLAIIFLRWGLKYTIIFHSFWNFYSL
ncbi:MAG: lysostaphin resistance A-like protein, partial [Candidatus Hodarchaeota archaeon]